VDFRARRQAQRQQLLAARTALSGRAVIEQALADRVDNWLQQADVHALGFYWPVRGEADLRPVIARWLAADSRRRAALPVIVDDILQFHQWTADAPMAAGPHGIAVPAHGRVLQPDCLLIPCLGFDPARYRLGYGGGYYDRTLTNLVPWPLAVGIAFEISRLESVDPQRHDVRLDVVLTESAQY
jgi:5-formyltetrahydrofolate cyclo-ligase